MKSPELLLPAGGLERMQTAFDFGADAVYAGSPRYSLRARNNEFAKLDVLQQGITEAHQRGKKFFLTVNTLPHNSKLKTFHDDMQPLIAMKPDALIMADPGLIMEVREKYPEMPIHLSVQANTTNYWGVKFWQKIGVERIILSRELSLEEIAEIRQQCPDIELEVFVHGALCIAYSGRCLLSGYFNHRDPNQGTCTNSCRWDYKVHHAQEDEMGDVKPLDGFDFQAAQDEANIAFEGINGQKRHPSADKVFLIEESNRPGEMMPIMEDEHGTYIMNSKDLRAIEQVSKLVEIGVDSLKVEGRTKSAYYVARVTQSYRKAIDDAVAGKPFDYSLLAELEGLANRGYTSGFLERHQTQEYQNYLYGHSIAKQAQFVGQVSSINTDGWATIDVKNKFAVGDWLEIIHPSGNQLIKLEQMKRKGLPVTVASGNGIQVQIPNMQGCEKAMVARIIQNNDTPVSTVNTPTQPENNGHAPQKLNLEMLAPQTLLQAAPEHDNNKTEKKSMSNIIETLSFIMNLDGARAVSIVDANSGLMLGAQGGTGIDLEYASAANSELYQAKLKIMKVLGIESALEDFLITLNDQYHLLVPVPQNEGVFIYFVLDKERATVALARRRLKDAAAALILE